MAEPNQLSKSCIACGEEKSLSAFLQISGPQGTTYGNVCAQCRGSELDKKVTIPLEEGESETSSSPKLTLTIDAKVKVHVDQVNKQKNQQKSEQNVSERKKGEKITDDKTKRSELIEKLEKEHRTKYIEVKQSFLSHRGQSQTPEIMQKREALTKAIFLQQQNSEKKVKNEEAQLQHEQKLGSTDLSATAIDPRELKYQGEFLNRLKFMGGR
jgi:hypothetical protein